MQMNAGWRIASFAFVLAVVGSRVAGAVEEAHGDFAADFPAGTHLRLHIRSGDVRIVGSDRERITVRYEGRKASRKDETTVSLTRLDRGGDLTIKGGPDNEFRIILEVPRRTDLHVRMAFGDLVVAGVTGDKDVEVHAGDVTLDVGESAQYAQVDASVYSGELSASGFGVEKGGLFRAFKRSGNGRYRVHAHIGAGQLTLKS